MTTASSPAIDLSSYRDQHFKGTRAEQDRLLRLSTTLYIGNLSFFTTEEQIYELFSRCGDIRRVIMGLDKYKKTPCGFCFVEYYNRADAEHCYRYINGTRLDDRVVRTDWDAGFIEGRQYGRGKTGGQVRDEYRTDFDGGRGGYGKIMQQKSRKKYSYWSARSLFAPRTLVPLAPSQDPKPIVSEKRSCPIKRPLAAT